MHSRPNTRTNTKNVKKYGEKNRDDFSASSSITFTHPILMEILFQV
jgi:hypothetical protein